MSIQTLSIKQLALAATIVACSATVQADWNNDWGPFDGFGDFVSDFTGDGEFDFSMDFDFDFDVDGDIDTDSYGYGHHYYRNHYGNAPYYYTSAPVAIPPAVAEQPVAGSVIAPQANLAAPYPVAPYVQQPVPQSASYEQAMRAEMERRQAELQAEIERRRVTSETALTTDPDPATSETLIQGQREQTREQRRKEMEVRRNEMDRYFEEQRAAMVR